MNQLERMSINFLAKKNIFQPDKRLFFETDHYVLQFDSYMQDDRSLRIKGLGRSLRRLTYDEIMCCSIYDDIMPPLPL